MSWPPPLPPGGRGEATEQASNHPSDHNLTADALDRLMNDRLDVYETDASYTGIDVNVVTVTEMTRTFTPTPGTTYVLALGIPIRFGAAIYGTLACRLYIDGAQAVYAQLTQQFSANERILNEARALWTAPDASPVEFTVGLSTSAGTWQTNFTTSQAGFYTVSPVALS